MSALASQSGQPDFIFSIVHIFAKGLDVANPATGIRLEIRQLSGYVLKNYVLAQFKTLSAEIQGDIQLEIISALCGAEPVIRKTAANLVGKITRLYPMDSWRAMFMKVLEVFLSPESTTSADALDGSISAVQIICEDATAKLYDDPGALTPVAALQARPIRAILSRCLALFSHSEGSFRLRALEIANSLYVPVGTGAASTPSCGANNSDVLQLAQDYLRGLSFLAQDALPAVRLAVCHGIVLVATIDLNLFGELLPGILEFNLGATQDSDEEVAMEACEFWLCMLDGAGEEDGDEEDDDGFHTAPRADGGQGQGGSQVLPLLPRLIPALISRMQLPEEQVIAEREQERAEAQGAREVNMKPMHYRAKRDDDDSEEEAEGGRGGAAGGDGDDDGVAKFTVRRRSAAVLDRVGEYFSAEFVFPLALPIIQGLLASQTSVWERESGLMALGALAAGCMEALREVGIDSVVPYLLANLSGGVVAGLQTPPEVQSISCWVLGRYNQLLFPLPEPDEGLPSSVSEEAWRRQRQSVAAHQAHYKPVLERLLVLMCTSPEPKVQSSACTAVFGILQTAAEDVSAHISPFFADIVVAVQRAAALYGVKNALLLCDFIGALADITAESLQDPAHAEALLGIVMRQFDGFEDSNMYLFPVMECLVSVIPAVGLAGFQNHAIPTLVRCLRINETTLLMNNYADHCDAALEGGAASVGAVPASAILPPGTSNFLLDLAPVLAGPYNSARIEDEVPAKDFAICTLDIFTSLVSCLEARFALLLSSADAHVRALPLYGPAAGAGSVGAQTLFMNALLLGLQDPLKEVRQCAFSLAGELCRVCPALVLSEGSGTGAGDLAAQLLSLALQNVSRNATPEDPAVDLGLCSDASWMMGELLVKMHECVQAGGGAGASGTVAAAVAGFVAPEFITQNVMPVVIQLLLASGAAQCPLCLRQNAGILAGRVGAVVPAVLSGTVRQCFPQWCKCLALVRPSGELEEALYGLCLVLQADQLVMAATSRENFHALMQVAARWASADCEGALAPPVTNMMSQIVRHLCAGPGGSPELWRWFVSHSMTKSGKDRHTVELVTSFYGVTR